MQTASFLSLSGTGTISAAGFDDTDGSWTLSGTGVSTEFAFVSATGSAAAAVPEPTGAALFAVGGVLVGLSTRRTRA